MHDLNGLAYLLDIAATPQATGKNIEQIETIKSKAAFSVLHLLNRIDDLSEQLRGAYFDRTSLSNFKLTRALSHAPAGLAFVLDVVHNSMNLFTVPDDDVGVTFKSGREIFFNKPQLTALQLKVRALLAQMDSQFQVAPPVVVLEVSTVPAPSPRVASSSRNVQTIFHDDDRRPTLVEKGRSGLQRPEPGSRIASPAVEGPRGVAHTEDLPKGTQLPQGSRRGFTDLGSIRAQTGLKRMRW